jgi:hypothetical protein
MSKLNYIFFIAYFVTTILFGLWVWFRRRATISKPRFALLAMGTIFACLTSLLHFMSSPLIVAILNSGAKLFNSQADLSSDDNIWPGLFATMATVTICFLIYRMTIATFTHWHGPTTSISLDLDERGLGTSVVALTRAELARIFAGDRDNNISDIAIYWRQQLSEPPTAPQWELFARELFINAFPEASIGEDCWHDRGNYWSGEISESIGFKARKCVLFLFDKNVSDFEISTHVDCVENFPEIFIDTKMFAIYKSDVDDDKILLESRCGYIEAWSSQALLMYGLKLSSYARDLVRRFDNDVLGGTDKTLRDTFVPTHVIGKNQCRVSLRGILAAWAEDGSRRQLAITGEYGQGKSTAMLEWCADWARRFLAGGARGERVPLLIELRGQSPGRIDPLRFLSGWAGRFGISPKQLFSLIKSGGATLIFEGFDELQGAGLAYDRHEHFNALWQFAYPGAKIIFTGRPNFFIDQAEMNKTLRNDKAIGAAGAAFTTLFQISRLEEHEIQLALSGFDRAIANSVGCSIKQNKDFFEIVSRPSMLPVVVTIWPEIAELQASGQSPTSATLVERYLLAMYQRKEAEIEQDARAFSTPRGASYLKLPYTARDLFTLAVVKRMAVAGARNTITRLQFQQSIAEVYTDLLRALQGETVPPEIIERVRAFEIEHATFSDAERIELITTEVASAGLFVSDPAGGPSNLMLPHKQFYEYLISKIAWISTKYPKSKTTLLLSKIEPHEPFALLLTEANSVAFFTQIVEDDYSIFDDVLFNLSVVTHYLMWKIESTFKYIYNGGVRVWYIFKNYTYTEERKLPVEEVHLAAQGRIKSNMTMLKFKIIVLLLTSATIAPNYYYEYRRILDKLDYTNVVAVLIASVFIVLFQFLYSRSKMNVYRLIVVQKIADKFKGGKIKMTLAEFEREVEIGCYRWFRNKKLDAANPNRLRPPA